MSGWWIITKAGLLKEINGRHADLPQTVVLALSAIVGQFLCNT